MKITLPVVQIFSALVSLAGDGSSFVERLVHISEVSIFNCLIGLASFDPEKNSPMVGAHFPSSPTLINYITSNYDHHPVVKL